MASQAEMASLQLAFELGVQTVRSTCREFEVWAGGV